MSFGTRRQDEVPPSKGYEPPDLPTRQGLSECAESRLDYLSCLMKSADVHIGVVAHWRCRMGMCLSGLALW